MRFTMTQTKTAEVTYELSDGLKNLVKNMSKDEACDFVQNLVDSNNLGGLKNKQVKITQDDVISTEIE